MAMIGYARVSTEDQNLALQINALEKVPCDEIFMDEGVSALARERPGYEQAIAALRPGDALVLWKYDRAFRSLRHALDALDLFEAHGFQFRCLTEEIETETYLGRGLYQIRHVIAEIERNMLRERTRAGMQAARKAGKHIGRPRKLSEAQIREIAMLCRLEPDIPAREIASAYGVSSRTIFRLLSRRGRYRTLSQTQTCHQLQPQGAAYA
ncbi:MAG: recombinase family protein [Wenzhouxiangellaceae bacterium]